MNTEEILRKLISYKTVSETSNNYLADFIIKFLKGLGIKAIKIKGEEGRFNVYCKIGPNVDGGIILSGHTDVVPTEGQEWKTNPFELVRKKNKLFGRGSADMKGFIAVVLSLMREIKKDHLKNHYILFFHI